MFSLKGMTALVTGSATGIGAAIAEAFARQGAKVIVADRDQKGAEAEAEKIRSQKGDAEAVTLDVTQEADCFALAARLPALDILVNNAGIGHVGNLFQTKGEDLDRLYAVNIRGVFNICKAFVPKMIEAKSGSVINIASVGGVVAVRDRFAYTTTKFAVVGLTKALALDHSDSGVRVNCICPGRVETEFVQKMISQYPDPEKAYRDMAATQLNGRMARPDEVASSAVYLASRESAMMTGSCLMLDGGWTAGK